MSREVEEIFENQEQSEGEGATVRRSIGGYELRNFNPFLLLDEFYGEGNSGLISKNI